MIELKRAGYNIELSAPLDNTPFSTSSERERIEENVCTENLDKFPRVCDITDILKNQA